VPGDEVYFVANPSAISHCPTIDEIKDNDHLTRLDIGSTKSNPYVFPTRVLVFLHNRNNDLNGLDLEQFQKTGLLKLCLILT
jgi:hypothetical protein